MFIYPCRSISSYVRVLFKESFIVEHIEKLKESKRIWMKNRLMLERKQFIIRIHI